MTARPRRVESSGANLACCAFKPYHTHLSAGKKILAKPCTIAAFPRFLAVSGVGLAPGETPVVQGFAREGERLEDEHRVAITIKAVALRDRCAVCGQ
jgi:hypothetical protein